MTGPQHSEHPAVPGRAPRSAGSDPALPDRAAPQQPPPTLGRGHRPRRAVEDRDSFGVSLGWSVLGTVLPGVGLLGTRARAFGVLLLGTIVALTLVIGMGVLLAPNQLLNLAVLPGALTVAWAGLVVFGLSWIGSIVATHLLRRPNPPSGGQRFVGAAAIGVLALAVALPTSVGARTIYDTGELVNNVFGREGAAAVTDQGGTDEEFGNAVDPWANKPRLNVLVLGGDAGPDREGTRTDTVILASIDTRTGNTVLFSLPRQTARMPFPAGTALDRAFPDGFTNGDPLDQNYALSAIYGVAPTVLGEDALGDVEDPGAHAVKLAVGEALGLRVDYFAMVNMDGFVELVNALGGITVNVNVPVPVGGKNPTYIGGSDGFPPDRWLVPGPDQHLNGADALWFARGRYRTDDYARMSRQRCVIQAVVQQIRPATVLTNYEALTKAGSNIVATDMPNRQAPAMVNLALKVKDASLSSISFEHDVDGFSTTHPDWDAVRQRVRAALTAPVPTPAADAPGTATPDGTAAPDGTGTDDGASATPTASASPRASASPSAVPTASATPNVTPTPSAPTSVQDECAYHPQPWPPEEG